MLFFIDQTVFDFIHQLVGKSRLLDLLAIFFADYVGYILILIFLFLIFSNKKWREDFYNLAFISLVLLLSRGIFTETIRFFYNRPRPFEVLIFNPLIGHGTGGAFPSGHMAFYFAMAFSLLYLGYKQWGIIFSGVTLLMGISRVFVGVHWPLDIFAGILVAFLSVHIVKILLIKNKPIKIS